jgi:hypothetical protein
MLKGKYFLSVFLFVLISGCVSLSIRSNLNKDYSEKRYNRIVVISTSEDSDFASNAENQIENNIDDQDLEWVTCFKYSENYYAGSNTNPDVFKNKLKKFIENNKADGILFVSDNGVDAKGVITGFSARTYGFAVNRATVRSVGVVMELFDARTKESVWYSRGGSATSSVLVSNERLMNSFIDESMSRLVNTGLLDEK